MSSACWLCAGELKNNNNNNNNIDLCSAIASEVLDSDNISQTLGGTISNIDLDAIHHLYITSQ